MGIYNSAVITNTGQALLAQSVAGNDLKFTTVKTSNYTYPSGTSLADLTTLTGIKQSKNITGATVYNSRVIKVSAMVDNAGVTAEYSINTIGVYATVGTAAEQLFAVITAQEADKMPAFNSRPYSYIYDLNMTMQGTANITVTVNNAGFVNINDLNNALEGINESIESINEDLSTLSEDKVNVSDIINNLVSSDTNKPLSAAMGKELSNMIQYGTWVPHIYDYDTYKRTIPGTQSYIKIGKFVVATINSNQVDLTGISTMLQIRNLPMDFVYGGSVYIAGIKDGTSGASETIQASNYVYLRPNIQSGKLNGDGAPGSVGWVTMLLLGAVN